MEQTFIMIKPDGVQRGLIGPIIERFERKGFQLVAMKMIVPSKEIAETHYAEHKERPFFGGLVNFLTSGPVVAMVWAGENVVKTGRTMIGATKPAESTPGSIRGDYGVTIGRNIIHGSDGEESAKREIGIWFKEDEICQWEPTLKKWIYE
eukprot:GCRY01000273.1.p1 GENE.GCRY01000273.1~~GCRY01000273.1.p1  ORF type:complete len:150 (+),score=38.48 GCRY01000273.1:38-487(+)